MGKVKKIAPIIKTHNPGFKTFESSLAVHGMSRAPGTGRTFIPYKEAGGKYRTGLDPDANYLKRLVKEDFEAEVKRIKEDKTRLAQAIGVDESVLDPGSQFWNVYSNEKIKAVPVKLGNKEEFFDFSDPMREITFSWLKVYPTIAPSLDALKRGDISDAQYYIADDEAENKWIYDRKKQINRAIVDFEEMTPTKKKRVARLLGLPVSEATTEELVYNLVDNVLKQTEFTEGQHKGFSTVRVFQDIVNLSDDRLRVKDTIEQAIRHSLYREGANGKITEGNITIATSKDELVTKLLDPENQVDLLALEKRLEVKKFTNVS